MVDLVVILALVLVLGGAIAYVIREKKKGRKCIGCPYADSCTKCNCGSDKK